MMKWSVGTKMSFGFGILLAVFVTVGGFTYLSMRQLIAAADARKHAHDVSVQLLETLSELAEISASQRGYVITGDESYLESYGTELSHVDQNIQSLRTLTAGSPSQQRSLDALEPLVTDYLAFIKRVVETRRASGAEAAASLVKSNTGQRLLEQIRRIGGDMRREEHAVLNTWVGAVQQDVQRTQRTFVGGTIAALILASIAGFLITRNIARPLQTLTIVAERISEGDLRAKVSTNGRLDEVGVLGNTFARMIENLRVQTRQLVDGANVLGASTNEIVASTTQLAANATESAAAVSETTATVEEVKQTAQLATQKAKSVSDSAQKVAQISQTGRQSTEDAVAGMARIQEQMDAIAASMVRLSEHGETIGEIIAVVEDLAAQSNLLAVNAAIEATKAGEHGKGFSVVAQEVKSLAEQSRQATKQVRTILGEMQKATTTAVLTTEQGTKAVEAGTRQTTAAGESIQILASSVSEAAQAATQIAASSQQQLVGVDQVAMAMGNIKQSSTQNVASATQLESAARNLNELGQQLRQMVERYQM